MASSGGATPQWNKGKVKVMSSSETRKRKRMEPNPVWIAIYKKDCMSEDDMRKVSDVQLNECNMYVDDDDERSGVPPMLQAAMQWNFDMVLAIAKERMRRGMDMVTKRDECEKCQLFQIHKDVLYHCANNAPDGNEALHYMLKCDLMYDGGEYSVDRRHTILAILAWTGKLESVKYALSIIEAGNK